MTINYAIIQDDQTTIAVKNVCAIILLKFRFVVFPKGSIYIDDGEGDIIICRDSSVHLTVATPLSLREIQTMINVRYCL